MNIIVRNPFISKRRRELAKIYLNEAEAYFTKASEIETKEKRLTEDSVELCKLGSSRLNLAAKALGFLNSNDMERYVRKHKKLP